MYVSPCRRLYCIETLAYSSFLIPLVSMFIYTQNDSSSFLRYLGFEVKDGIVYYLTGSPIIDAVSGSRLAGKKRTNKGESRGVEHLHLVTFELASRRYCDHGPLFYRNRPGFPTYVNSLAVGGDGWLYALGRMESGLTDVFRVRNPFLFSEGDC